jgi:hypothetical protein
MAYMHHVCSAKPMLHRQQNPSEERVHKVLADIVDLEIPEKEAVLKAADLSPEEMRMLVRLISSREEETFQDTPENPVPTKRKRSAAVNEDILQRRRLVHS